MSMRYVATYLPLDTSRIGRGRREFLYVESLSRDQVLEHARANPPDGYTLVDVRPARSETEYRYLPVPQAGDRNTGESHGPA